MKTILTQPLARFCGHLEIPYRRIRVNGEIAQVDLERTLDFPDLVIKIKSDIRYDKSLEYIPDGVFVNLEKCTVAGFPVLADLVIKIREAGHLVKRITCVLKRAYVYRESGRAQLVQSFKSLKDALEDDGDDRFTKKGLNSVSTTS